MSKQTIKVTFGGDIMSLLPQDTAARQPNGSYNYHPIFDNIRPYLLESDLVVANLETVFGGNGLGYTNTATSFNTPDEFAQAIKEAGVDVVSTANNHCLDRGIDGLKRTLDVLDEIGIKHTGTYKTEQENDQILVVEVQGIKIAILAFTYGTNSEYNNVLLTKEELFHVDILKKQALSGVEKIIRRGYTPKERIKSTLAKYIGKLLPENIKKHIKTYLPFLKQNYTKIVIDNVPDIEIDNPINGSYLNNLSEKINKANTIADFVVLYLHIGGQYNSRIGKYTRHIIDWVKEQHVDFIIGNHPHCILEHETTDKQQIVAHALGNFTATPYWGYWEDGVYAEYSVLLNVYFDTMKKSIVNTTYSIIKSQIESDKYSKIYHANDLIDMESNLAQKRVKEIDYINVAKRFARDLTNTIPQKEHKLNN